MTPRGAAGASARYSVGISLMISPETEATVEYIRAHQCGAVGVARTARSHVMASLPSECSACSRPYDVVMRKRATESLCAHPLLTSAACAVQMPSEMDKQHEPKRTKHIEQLGVPWEAAFGYAQVVESDGTLYLSGQLDHDASGKMTAPAPLDANGRVTDFANMGQQIRQAYVNAAALLARFGATLDDVVEEVMYVLDLDAAFAAAPAIRREAYAREMPQVANTLVATPRLAFREQLVEIKFVARLPAT